MHTRDVFERLGFDEEWETIADGPAYAYDFGNLRLSAIECMGKYFRRVFRLTGLETGPRSIGIIEFDMPCTVESFEQGVALIAHSVGMDFEPARPTPWLSHGREWQSFLPWEKARKLQEQAYAAAPKCSVARDWFRVARPRLYAMAKGVAEDDCVWLTFDGEILRFAARNHTVIVPATGEAWPDRYAIEAAELDFIPKRIATDPVRVIVWEDALAIDRRRWRLVR